MALQPQRKFCTPPTFYGKPDEDGVDWLQRYEDTATYNNWTHVEKLGNFGRYIEGACRKWFRCLIPQPTSWEDIPAAVGPPVVHFAVGLKNLFKNSFQEGNYGLFQQQKLRNKVQKDGEDPISYFYDILDLCRTVDVNMDENTKIDHLYNGISKELLKQIYLIVRLHMVIMISNHKGSVPDNNINDNNIF